MDIRERLESAPINDNLVYPNREILGSLNYLMVSCRPDLCYVVSLLSRYMDRQSEELWMALKRVLRYLKGTKNYGITLKCENSNFSTYSDADWGGDLTDRKSTSGVLILYGTSPLIWQCKKQSCVATSTTEAEYISMAEASKWMIWLKQLQEELEIEFNLPLTLYSDSQSALFQVKDPACRPKAKHIDIKYHFIKDLVESDIILPKHVASANMYADIFTKPISKIKFIELLKAIGIVNYEDHAKLSGSNEKTGN